MLSIYRNGANSENERLEWDKYTCFYSGIFYLIYKWFKLGIGEFVEIDLIMLWYILLTEMMSMMKVIVTATVA
jgi:hypothetical protein